MEYITIRILKKMWLHLLKEIEDNDYCFFCDNHPSHGHDKECPLVKP